MSLPAHQGESAPASADEMGHEELLRRMQERSLTLVDVLPAESFRSGHIPGALNLPLLDLKDRAADVLLDRSAFIATYCGGFT